MKPKQQQDKTMKTKPYFMMNLFIKRLPKETKSYNVASFSYNHHHQNNSSSTLKMASFIMIFIITNMLLSLYAMATDIGHYNQATSSSNINISPTPLLIKQRSLIEEDDEQKTTTRRTTKSILNETKNDDNRNGDDGDEHFLNLQNDNRAKQILALCEAKKRCLFNNKTSQFQGSLNTTGTSVVQCPTVWDGALCWPSSPANQIIQQPCPKYVKGFNHNGRAYKNCTASGVWYYNNDTRQYWTDYSECAPSASGSSSSSSSSSSSTSSSSSSSNGNGLICHYETNHNDDDETLSGEQHRNKISKEEEDYDFSSSKLTRIFPHLPNFQIISHLGYSISFISLVIAFFILVYVKRLRCPRNSLHLQLFISFIIRSSMYLIKTSIEQFPFDLNQLLNVLNSRSGDAGLTSDHGGDEHLMIMPNVLLNHHNYHNHLLDEIHNQTSKAPYLPLTSVASADLMDKSMSTYETNMLAPSHSPIVCKIFTTIWQYSLLANYNWIFMEGLYLHNVIFLNIFNDNSNIIPYIILGWCLPIPVVTLWAMMRSFYEDTSCWKTNTNWKIFWITRAPITITIVLNFFFFVNIIRVLFLKMFAKSAATPARKYKYRTWFRSTLVLVPLFGVHYMFFLAFNSFTFNSYDIFEIIWLYTDLTFTTFQGCLVALLYCFFNHEVQVELRKLWLSFKQSMLSSRHYFIRNNSSLFNGNHHNQQQTCSRNTRHSLISDCSSFFNKKENFTSSDLNYHQTSHHHHPHHHAHHHTGHGNFGVNTAMYMNNEYGNGPPPQTITPCDEWQAPPETGTVTNQQTNNNNLIIEDINSNLFVRQPDPLHQFIFGETSI